MGILSRIAKKRGLNMAELAAEYGVSRQYLYKLNKRLISKERAELLRRIYEDSGLEAAPFLSHLLPKNDIQK